MRRRLAALDRLDAATLDAATLAAATLAGATRPRRRLRHAGIIVPVAAGVGLLGFLTVGADHIPLSVLRAMQQAGSTPPIPADVQRRPLGVPAPAPAGRHGRLQVHAAPTVVAEQTRRL